MKKYSFGSFLKTLTWKDTPSLILLAGYIAGRIIELVMGKFTWKHTLYILVFFIVAEAILLGLRYSDWLKFELKKSEHLA